jgi:hypothetical protein
MKTEPIYALIKQHKNDILDTGDWWWTIDGHDINVHCLDDENFENAEAVFSINLYELDLGDTSSYTKNEQFDLPPLTRREIRLL